MPLVTANPRGRQDGSTVTEFTDTTNTSAVTYTYPSQQSSLIIENSGERVIYVTVGSVTDQPIQVDTKYRYDGSFTTFSIRSDVNSQEFIATAIYKAAQDLTEVSDQLDILTTSLAEIELQKATKTDVNNSLALKRDKSVLISESDISDTLKQQINGNAPISQTLAPKTVSPLKTTFIKRGNQLFNKTTALSGKYVSFATGVITDNAGYYASDFIPITGGVNYFKNDDLPHYAWYDNQFNFISGGTNGLTPQKILTAPANAVYIRISVPNGSINNYMFCEGSSVVPYEEYTEYLDVKYLNDLPPVKIKNVEGFQLGKNKFNKSTAISGSYVDHTTGLVWLNASYYVSDWIPVQANTQYTYNQAGRTAIYDDKKVFITGYNGQPTFTTPSNAAYIIISILVANINTAQVELGSIATTYESYGYINNLINITQKKDFFELLLPKELCVAVGRTIELYNKQICHTGNLNNYHFSFSCDVGQQRKRKWTLTATSGMIGSHALIVTVYDNDMNVITTGSVTIKVVNKSTEIATAKKMLCIGDSLSSSKPWTNELKSLSDTLFGADKLQFIGTQGVSPYKTEGYSGWSTNNFATNFVSQVILTVSGVTTPPSSKKRYTVPDNVNSYTWEVESTNIVAGSGTITLNIIAGITRTPLANGTITAVDGAGTGDSSINYSSYVTGKSNPFWNQSTGQLDFNNYLTVNSLTKPDIVQIFLGANEVGLTIGGYDTVVAALQTSINNMKTIVDKIISQWSGTKIYIVLTPFYADQNGLGINYGSSNYRNESQMHLDVFVLAKLMMAQFNNYNSAVTIVPVAQTMDSDYGYAPVQQIVNPRSTVTELVQTGMVHPDDTGYYQIADVMFSHFVGHYLDA